MARFSRLVAFLALSMVSPAAGQYVLQNDLLRLGSGAEDSVVSTTGSLNQPFLLLDSGWSKLTYSTYDLNFELKLAGVSQTFGAPTTTDTSGFTTTSTSGGFNIGYGTIFVVNSFTSGTTTVSLKRTYTLPSGSSPLTIGLEVAVGAGGDVAGDGVQLWVGTSDDWLGTSDRPTKTVGTFTGNCGTFTAGTTGTALEVSSDAEQLIFYTEDAAAKALIASCCSFNNVVGLDPATTFPIEGVTSDGSYALYFPYGTMSASETLTKSAIYEPSDPTATSCSSSSSSSDDSLSGADIAGIVVGSVAGAALIGGAVVAGLYFAGQSGAAGGAAAGAATEGGTATAATTEAEAGVEAGVDTQL